MIKALFWTWLLILLILNVIPIGNEASKAMSGNVFVFRLDYLIHTAFFLVFAWIYLVSHNAHRPIFKKHEKLTLVIVSFFAAVVFEVIQRYVPYRAFNPYDLIANLTGAIAGSVIICIN